MIEVDFTMDPGTNIEADLRYRAKLMPWLKYLIDHSTSYSVQHDFDFPYQSIVRIGFNLPLEKETFYLLKYR